MSKRKPLPPVSYYLVDGAFVRNHREHRRHWEYSRYLFETADIAKIDGKIVGCQSCSFEAWPEASFVPLGDVYHQVHVQLPIGSI